MVRFRINAPPVFAKKKKEMMLIVMKMICLYPLEVYNFELRFSQNTIKHAFGHVH